MRRHMKDRFPSRRQSISTSHVDCNDYTGEHRVTLSSAPSPNKSLNGAQEGHDADSRRGGVRRKSVAPASLGSSPVKSNPQQIRPPVKRNILKDDNSSTKSGGLATNGKLRGFSEIKRSEEILAKENKELHASLLDLTQKYESEKTESQKSLAALETKVQNLEEKLCNAANSEREAKQKLAELQQENIRLTQRLEDAGINAITLSPIKEEYMSKSFTEIEKDLSLSSITVHTNISMLEDLMGRAKDVSLFMKNCLGPGKSADTRSAHKFRQPLRECSGNSINIEENSGVPTKIVVTSDISPPRSPLEMR